MSVSRKEFVLSHVITNASNVEQGKRFCSEEEDHFNVTWYLSCYQKKGFLSLYLCCREPSEKEWSIQLKADLTLSMNGRDYSKSIETSYGKECKDNWVFEQYVKWEELEEDFMIDGKFEIGACVQILRMTGIPRKKLINFDDENMKDCSDIVFIVEDKKFYVSKGFLSYHSSVFKSLLMGPFKESKMKEVPLKNIKAVDFQSFLEVIYGESDIDDDTVDGILKLADMYDAPTARRRCEQFLIENSEKSAREKLEISVKYTLKRLQKQILVGIKTFADLHRILPGKLENLEQPLAVFLLRKFKSLYK